MFQVLSLVLGAIGIGYAIRTFITGQISIYSYFKRELIVYRGPAGQIVSIGLLMASIGLILVGWIGFVSWGLLLLSAGSYYGALFLANRMDTDE